MSTITFYRQARRDGGVRTGIEVNDNTVLAGFQHGELDPDPALVWYVDVRCRGGSLPTDAPRARAWLIRHAPQISRLLNALADRIPVGIDPGDWPLEREAALGPGIRVKVACSAVRRAEAARLAEILRDTAAHWRDHIEELEMIEA